MNFDDVLHYNIRRFFSLLVRLTLIFVQKQQIKSIFQLYTTMECFFFLMNFNNFRYICLLRTTVIYSINVLLNIDIF